MHLYNEYQEAEQALRSHVIDAFLVEYLNAIRHAATDMISDTIPNIITYLQSGYRQFTD